MVRTCPTPANVLIVDDEYDIRETLTEALADNGFKPYAVANGVEALAYLRAQASLPSVILLDMRMPIMDGADFRREQLADPALGSIPVIVLTANLDIRSMAASLGAAGFLRKPVRLDPLLALLRQHVAAG